jgi:capsular exopolysaccharide synthesis family protein
MALARARKRVLLVDLDLRQPQLADVLDVPTGPGITSILLGEAELSEALRKVSVTGGLSMLAMPAGAVPTNPGLLLEAADLPVLIERLRGTAEVVIIDAPPVLGVADALVLAPLVDGVVLVVGAGVTRRRNLLRAIALIRQASGVLLGVVLNYTGRRPRRGSAPPPAAAPEEPPRPPPPSRSRSRAAAGQNRPAV